MVMLSGSPQTGRRNSLGRRRAALAGATVAVALATSGAVALGSGVTTTGSGWPHVYQGVLNCCQNVVLGPQASPTTIVSTPTLPAGRYLIHYEVGVNMEPADNVVCAAGEPNNGPGMTGNFASAGNGALESSFGGGAGVYGSPNGVGTITLTSSSMVQVVCNNNDGKGTYVASASIVAQPVGKLTVLSEP